jgi:hypothetical protein
MGLQVDPEYELGIGPDGRPFCALSENLWANFSGGVEPYSLLFPLSAFPMTLEHIESVIRVLSGAVWMEGGGWVQYQRLTGSVVEISTSEPQWG